MSKSDLTNNITNFVNGLDDKKTILVFGDIMLDMYEHVHVNRLSPEFPIPVIDCGGKDASICTIDKPGGAANCAYQLSHFKNKTYLCSFINYQAKTLFNKYKFDTNTTLECQCHIPIKHRYYHDDFPLCRMDNEISKYGLSDLKNIQVDLFEKFITLASKNKIDAIILSDYNKGVFDTYIAGRIIDYCLEHDITTIVDPKKNPLQWQYCTIFKPNLVEAANFLHMNTDEFIGNWQECVKELKSIVKCQSVIVTNGGKGIYGINHAHLFEYKPEQPVQDVRSRIGAGDAFISILALANAHYIPIPEAAEIAYEAAAVYVQKKHNEPIWPHELLSRVSPVAAKILSPEEIKNILNETNGKKIAITNGCYDFGITRGHIDCLNFAKKNSDIVIVALNDDDSVKRLKGAGRPIMPLHDRMYVVAGLACVDFVTSFSEDTPLELIKLLDVDLIVKGGDYLPEDVVGYGLAEVKICPLSKSISTTEKINKFNDHI